MLRGLQQAAGRRRVGKGGFRRWVGAGVVSFLAVVGCGGEETDPDEPDPEPPIPGPGVDPICTAGTRWQPGMVAFREVTSEWGLDEIGVEGVRLSTVDYDGDGWADLTARHVGSTADDYRPEDGRYPGDRRTWLVRNTGQGFFVDVTRSSGFRQNRTEEDELLGRPGEVVVFADVDNDGDLDAYTGLAEAEPNEQVETSEIMVNQGDGTFALGPADSGVRVEAGDVPQAASFVDVDRNGLVDLWVVQTARDYSPQQDRLYAGDGTGRFVDVTAPLGLTTVPWGDIPALNEGRAHTYGWSAAACDLNGDGNAELLSASYGRAPNHLWQGTGPEDGSVFLNRSVASGYAFDHRTDWSDNTSARCYCHLYPTAEDCAGVPPPTYNCTSPSDVFRWNHSTDREPYRLGGNSATTICSDLDNDRHLDLVTTEIWHPDVGSSGDRSELLFNDGNVDVAFERPGREATGLLRQGGFLAGDEGDMSGTSFDFDNDGWPDVYIGSSDYPGTMGHLYHQEAPRWFVEVPYAEGIEHKSSHGIAVADYDRDGDLDVIVGHSRVRCSTGSHCYPTANVRMFENVLGDGGNWFQLQLVGGEGTNRAAIGARVEVTDEAGITQTQEVGGGYGQGGAQQDLTLHFGLGASCRATVTVRWPDAALTEQVFEVVAGYRFEVLQGEPPRALESPAQP